MATLTELEQDKTRATLVLVHQKGAALRVTMPDGRVLGVPGPRRQTIVALLEPGLGKAELRIDPAYQDRSRFDYSIQSILIEKDDPRYAAAQHLETFQTLWLEGDLDSARHSLEEVALIDSSPLLHDVIRFNLGQLCYQQFDFSSAQLAYDELSSDWWEVPENAAVTSWMLGAMALEQFELAQAKTHLTNALAAFQSSKHDWLKFDQIECALFLGLVLMRLGDVVGGHDLLIANMQEARALSNDVLVGKLNINLGGYYEFYRSDAPEDQVENFLLAYQHYKTAFDTLLPANIIADTVTARSNLGRLHQKAGEFGEALVCFQDALALNNQGNNLVVKGYLYSNLGRLYQLLGEHERGQNYLQGSYDIRASARAHRFQHRDAISLGRLERQKGNIHRATALHRNSADYYESLDLSRDQAEALYELAEDYFASGNLIEAQEYNNTALELLAADSDLQLSSRALRLDAQLAKANGETLRADEVFKQAVACAKHLPNSQEYIQTLGMSAEVCTDKQEALSYLKVAANLAESVRGQLEATRLGTSYSANVHNIFVSLATIQLQEGNITDALESMERGRATAFLLDPKNVVPETEAIKKAKLKINLLSERRINAMHSGSEDQKLTSAYFESLEALAQLIDKAGVQAEKASWQPQVANQGIVYFILGQPHSYAIWIFNEERQVYTLPSQQTFEQVTAEFHQSIQSSEPGSLGAMSLGTMSLGTMSLGTMSLGQMLFPQGLMEKIQQQKSITIIPHGVLHRVPFAALCNQNNQPLFAKTPLVLAYSLRSLRKSVSKQDQNLDFAIFANPVFNSSKTISVNDAQRDWSSNLEQLPWTAEEAKFVVEGFPTLTSKTYSGEHASKRNLFNPEVRGAKVLHIASHGFYHPNLKGIVGIALSSTDLEDSSSFVTVTDLVLEQFENHLVIVSGCETGLGEQMDGEGNLSISRAFLTQGVDAVISTLWPVSDRTSATFMKLFYQNLAQQPDPGLALSNAQSELRQIPRYRDPQHWAAYQIHTRCTGLTIPLEHAP